MAPRKRTSQRARKLPKRAPKRTTPKRKGSNKTRAKSRARAPAMPLMLTITAPERAKAERYHDFGDVEVEQAGDVDPDYRTYRHIEDLDEAPDVPIDFERVQNLGDYLPESWEGLRDLHDDPHLLEAWQAGEIEWLPTFDEVYDFIDALVDEYDLDPHELFELAFGYSDEVAA